MIMKNKLLQAKCNKLQPKEVNPRRPDTFQKIAIF